MKNVWLMFKAMICGLFSYGKFEDKGEFWDWYWNEQIPDARYPNESLWDCWDTFKYYATGKSLMWDVRMWFESHFNKKHFGYSWTFDKNGYFINNKQFFIPVDGSFQYGSVIERVEIENGNPIYFIEE